jgi:hypothetical protein
MPALPPTTITFLPWKFVLIFVDPFQYAGATVSGSSNWRALRKDRVAASGELGPVDHRLGFQRSRF